jgi:hypothetical protein
MSRVLDVKGALWRYLYSRSELPKMRPLEAFGLYITYEKDDS